MRSILFAYLCKMNQGQELVALRLPLIVRAGEIQPCSPWGGLPTAHVNKNGNQPVLATISAGSLRDGENEPAAATAKKPQT